MGFGRCESRELSQRFFYVDYLKAHRGLIAVWQTHG